MWLTRSSCAPSKRTMAVSTGPVQKEHHLTPRAAMSGSRCTRQGDVNDGDSNGINADDGDDDGAEDVNE